MAGSIHDRGDDRVLFLRAQREPDGSRTYRLCEAAPLPTSYGEDLYWETYGAIGGGRGSQASVSRQHLGRPPGRVKACTKTLT